MEKEKIYHNVILPEIKKNGIQGLHLLNAVLWSDGTITMVDVDNKEVERSNIDVSIEETPKGLKIIGKGAQIYRDYILNAFQRFSNEVLEKGYFM